MTQEAITESASSSRLSMQHLNIFKQENDAELLNRYIQLIPLTPDTSFRMTAGAGTVSERALMFAHLRRMQELFGYEYELEVAMRNDATLSWRDWCKNLYEQCIAYTGRNIHEVYGCAGNLLNGTDHFLYSFTKDFINKKYDIDGLNATYASEGGWEGHTRKFLVEQAVPRALKALA